MSLLDNLKWRYATKKFDSNKKLSAEQLDQLLSAIQLAPSSYGLQTYKILVVADAEIRQQLTAAAYGQQQLSEASQLLVFASETTIDEAMVNAYVDNIAATRNMNRSDLAQYEQMMVGTIDRLAQDQKIAWSHKQAYIALGVLMSAAADLHIDACPMEGFDAGKFDEILGLKEKGLTASVIAPIGFRAADDDYAKLAKVRRSKEELFIHI
ncbi:NAD(P)H-dependent oxidoreductase [Mucilaginibacter glaciei]|uniref:NAD(P)H-dependent oxidoreductase n=1 Tax=Mucilaginibacter glaciei TaxID=2772109 RepID=A0A926S1X6_9SPHI|nr:NAD(P)H-dependent oxidoreductase [Mucilaginibacter glaciei]MBD1393533.1 NAD(P)H-dependent oxidoreductase [Mucilaginibacter glaciei]